MLKFLGVININSMIASQVPKVQVKEWFEQIPSYYSTGFFTVNQADSQSRILSLQVLGDASLTEQLMMHQAGASSGSSAMCVD